ncbi:MAG: NAD(P)-binding domain-containing protein, partial [Ignavibacteriales bacterium]|nr:NAD(P)-binding domain-containing protein [Ignavibacteriales bacterium]
YDILIIGAGPAGISMAVESVHSGISASKILLLEKAEEHSFSIKKYYPENKVVTANFKGFEAKCTGVLCIPDQSKHEIITYLDKAIQENNLQVRYGETVWKLHQNDDKSFIVYTEKSEYRAKIVTIAIGILGKPNKPEYKFPSSLKDVVFYDVTTKEITGAKVLVVGGGDSASEYCQYLSQTGNTVALSYRKKDFVRMNAINRESLLELEREGKVKILYESEILSLEDKEGKPLVIMKNEKYPPQIFDDVVYALGGTTPSNFLKLLGIAFEGEEPIVKEHHETSVQGLFLLGDLVAGTKGGSIIWAFNSSRNAMTKICTDYLQCSV